MLRPWLRAVVVPCYSSRVKLNRLHRASLLILGVGMLSIGITASVRAWSAAGVISLILPGLLLLVFAIVGVFPNVHLKEGNIDWPKVEEPKPEDSADRESEELAQLRKELAEVRARLED